jgi:hypothetical protein
MKLSLHLFHKFTQGLRKFTVTEWYRVLANYSASVGNTRGGNAETEVKFDIELWLNGK